MRAQSAAVNGAPFIWKRGDGSSVPAWSSVTSSVVSQSVWMRSVVLPRVRVYRVTTPVYVVRLFAGQLKAAGGRCREAPGAVGAGRCSADGAHEATRSA